MLKEKINRINNEVLDKITKHLNDLAIEGDVALVNDRISWKDMIDMHKIT